MSFTLNQALDRLRALTSEVEAAAVALAEAETAARETREAQTQAYAHAFLCSEGPMDVRKQNAILETADERIAAETAVEIVRGLKVRIATLGLRVEVGRSISSALKAELSALGSAA